jgi:diadenosine tetraphosphate (Ap4A) HIT family hydrolase
MFENISENFSGSAPVRFSKVLLNDVGSTAELPSDVVLHRDEELIVCPTLGSFLPYWYLIIPTKHYLNFSDWEQETEKRSVATRVQRFVRSALGQQDDYIWFEHGPASHGSITGCGVDHAHLHIILETGFEVKDLLNAAAELGVQDWLRSDFDGVFNSRTDGAEYLAFGDSSTGYLKNLIAPVGSQFFRRALSHLGGNRADWDYKQHPHQQTAQQSVDRILGKGISGPSSD